MGLKIDVTPTELVLTKGAWFEGLMCENYFSDCTQISWCSDNHNVVAVNESSGYIYAKNPGTANVYATENGVRISEYISVTVTVSGYAVPVTAIGFNKTKLSLTKGETGSLSYSIGPSNATYKSVEWYSSNPLVAEVDARTGVITAKSVGNCKVMALARDGSGAFAHCEVQVNPIRVLSITLNQTEITLNAGETSTLTATVCPQNAEDKRIRWTSCDCNIADVDYLTGCVTAKSAGTTCICANAIDGSGVYGCCKVTCNISVSGTDSIGVFQTLSAIGTLPGNTETEVPVITGVQFTKPQNGKYNIRFVSQIKTLNCQSLGYKIRSKIGDTASVSSIFSSDTVYLSLTADGKQIYPNDGFKYFVVGVIENVPENTVASFKITPLAITSNGEHLYGNTTLFSCKDAQKIDYYYISNKTDDSKVISYKNALDGALKGANYRADVCVEPLIRSAKQIWHIANVSETVNGCYIRAYLDDAYGFNFLTTNSNCDLRTVDDNLNDAAVRFIDQGNDYYKICLAKYENYYLTMTEGYDVRWVNEDNENDNQLWKLNAVDWEQYEAEHVEYHLLCNGDTSRALRVGITNILNIKSPRPVRGERLSYWNRQKWTIKGEGTQKRLCSQLNNAYFLCNDGAGNARVSNNASDSNSHLTIEPYGNTGKYTIKLSGGNLYLTLVYGEYVEGSDSYDAEWGKWCNFNSDDPSMQLWEFKDQPATNHLGVDTKYQISNTTAKILKKEGMDFAIKYYATKANISPENYDKILTASEVTALHNAGLKIVVVYEDGGKTFSTERGTSDAIEALRLATLLGQQEGSAIYFGVEPEYSDQENAIAEYFAAVQKEFLADGRYKVGVYGVAKVCNNIKDTLDYAEYSWIGSSTNLSGSSSIEGDADYIDYDGQQKYNIKQSEPTIYNEVEFDRDTTIKQDFGAW